MDVYRTDRIRNVVLLGHGGSGKTTLAEAMAYLAGMTNRLGRVEDGNTVSDFDKEEIKRHFSISTTLIPVPWDKVKINVLDTPGYFDFVGEVEEAVSAADAAIIVVSGKAGVQVGTQKAWNLCEKYKLPRMFFVTDMDVDDVSYRKVVEELTELYGKKIAPLHFPIRENGKFVGYVNVVKQAGRKYIDKAGKEPCDIPEYLNEYLEKYHDILISGNRFGELKDDGKEVSLKELVSYPWISLTAETITRRFLNEYFEKNSLTFTPDMELATTDMILPAVRHNLGLGFIPAEFADSELKSGQVFEIKVKEKLPERNIILIYDVEYPQSIAAKEFQKFLKEKEM